LVDHADYNHYTQGISDSRQLDILLPTVDEERAIPMIFMPIPFLSASFFFSTTILLLAAIPILVAAKSPDVAYE